MITKVYWHICKAPNNMGDLISAYIFGRITGKLPQRSLSTKEPFILSCGSIMNHSNSKAIIWGTGAMKNCKIKKPLKVLTVRGPLTRQVLLNNGISCPEIYGDPGLLLPHFYKPNRCPQSFLVGIIPHYADYDHIKQQFSGVDNVLVIDINRKVEQVCDDIVACKTTISSSLHGIITSHAYNIKSAWMTVSPHSKWPIGGGSFKYNDYYLSRNVDNVIAIEWENLPTNAQTLYQLIEKFPQPNNVIDTGVLLDKCPFGKNINEIL